MYVCIYIVCTYIHSTTKSSYCDSPSSLSEWESKKELNYACLSAARSLHEVSLHESIRYAPGDAVEKWLNDLLCLDCLNIPRLISGCPLPQTCDLYPPKALC